MAAGVCRELGEKTRERTEIARDRINRAEDDDTQQDAIADGADNADNVDAPADTPLNAV